MSRRYPTQLGGLIFLALSCQQRAPRAGNPVPRPAFTIAPPPAVASSGGGAGLSAEGERARAPKVRLQALVVERGHFEAEVFHRIIRQRAPDLRDCYLPRLAERPGLEGQLHFRLQLEANADISHVETVANTLGDAEAQACVKAVMQSLVLPSPDEAPAQFVVPLTFTP